MPRRRTSANSAARRIVTEDARCNGSRTSPPAATQTKTAKGIPKEPLAGASPTGTHASNSTAPPTANKHPDGSPPASDASAAASATGDLGYLHKKFKKVAATFSAESVEHAPQERAASEAAQQPSVSPPADEAAKQQDNVLLVDGNPTKTSQTKSGAGRYVCPYCQHACAKPSVLEKHIRAHTNERPYPCIPCGFAFKTKSNLYKHCKSRTHVLKVEETGQTAVVDATEGGSDDTSENDENAPMDDSDEGEPIVVQTADQIEQITSTANEPPPSSSSPDKFKTPYKPKFHNLKPTDDGATETVAPVTSEASVTEVSSAPTSRPSPGFLQERISQIISQNQAIVETMDPIWPRRYVRQSSRDKEPVQSRKTVNRERSCSLTVETIQTQDVAAKPSTNLVQSNPTIKFLQESDDVQRKRSFSEGPGDNQLRHSVRNLLHKQPRNEAHPQNPEGSIIKDILLKSRGLLPPVEENPVTSSSFSVSALLSKPELTVVVNDDENQAKRAKLSPVTSENGRRKTALSGGEVEICDGQQRTVLRIDPFDEKEASTSFKPVPHVPGMPGPYSSGNVVYATTAKSVPVITVTPEEKQEDETDKSSKSSRPSTLDLQPGTFSLKKTNMTGMDVNGQPSMLCVSGSGMTLVSPETPRPRKIITQQYLNGHAYTYLGLKCSTRVYFCCLSKAQPMYVPHQPKLSMYSQWTTRPNEPGSPVESMNLYDSRQRPSSATIAHSSDSQRMILTHSSYWTNRDRPASANVKIEELDERSPVKQQKEEQKAIEEAPKVVQLEKAQQPKRIRIFAGGFKSTEEYTYVRGRGRGRYVCEECGIRCKKPSMLKKHIRTHTDLRPYTCRQCNFSFKTKGNLTKHMKSKAHHKKCTELGIVPVPTSVDDANIDEESLARQESMKKLTGSSGEGESDVEDEDDEDDDEDDELDEEDDEEEENNEESGQFEDAEPRLQALGEREQEVARSLLDLGVMAPAGLAKPTTYPYAIREKPEEMGEVVEIKEEAKATTPVPQVKSQAVDLSNRCSSPTQFSASIYASKVVSEPDHLSPEAQVPASNMLQAYLTEKAMKEGQMKRQQAKLPSSVPTLVITESKPREAEPQRVEVVVKPRPEFAPPSTAAAIASSAIAAAAASGSAPPAPVTYRLTDDGKTACSICNKVFTKPSQLRLHINIHYFERPFRCEACAVSFRTKGHLQKHKRSVTHFNKVNMNLTFGTPSTENPRPFKCSDCMIAFRIHGHLAKHLRSKMHIMKLECLGKLPFGTYAEMERSGVNLNEIDTTDCHNSLESLQSLAHRLYKQDPAKIQQWQQQAQVASESRERTVSCSSEEFSDIADDGEEMDEDGDESDGLPDEALRQQQRKMETLEPAQMPPPKVSPQPPETKRIPSPAQALICSACGESFSSNEAFQSHVLEKHRPNVNYSSQTRHDLRSPSPVAPVKPPGSSDFTRPVQQVQQVQVQQVQQIQQIQQATEVRRESPTRTSEPSRPVQWSVAPDLTYPQPQLYYPHHNTLQSHVWPGRPKFPEFLPLSHPMATLPPHWHQEPAAMAWMASRHLMLPLTIGGSLPAPNYPVPAAPMPGYPSNGPLRAGRHLSPVPAASSNIPGPSDDNAPGTCEICGKSFANKEQLRQHMMSHAQLRPFVCEYCDAGFTTQKHLEAHLVLHRPRTS